MTVEAAQAFLDRVETDKTLANELRSIGDDPEAVFARVRAAGFDVSVGELREASLDRYGAALTAEQLDAVAGGLDAADAGLVILILWFTSSD